MSIEKRKNKVRIYRGLFISLVLALHFFVTDDQSWDYMIAHGKDVFPEAPIVFCGKTAGKIDVTTLKPNVTGNFKSLDAKNNFENILHIQPNTTEIYVIVGTWSMMKSRSCAWNR